MEKVSCLMLTKDRPDLFRRSFECYCTQTYQNKELVIVCDGAMAYQKMILELVLESGRTDVKYVSVSPKPLGALRNTSVEVASGELICQWDDDDISHPQRVAAQVAVLRECKVEATYLSEHLHLFEDTKDAHCWNWKDSSGVPGEYAHPGTLLSYKRILPPYEEKLRETEDLVLSRCLFASGLRVGLISGLGDLHIYTYHGSNTYARPHHEWLNSLCSVSAETVLKNRDQLSWALTGHQVRPPLTFKDRDGIEIFTWRGEGDDCIYADQGHEVAVTVIGRASPGNVLNSDANQIQVITGFPSSYGLGIEEKQLRLDY